MELRIKVRDGKVYHKTSSGWKKKNQDFPSITHTIRLYAAQNVKNVLIDTKNPQFYKGSLIDGKERGARIAILPNGEKLEKAFSLFAPHLTFHDQDSHDHWDVLYQNAGGTWSYIYTLKKRKAHRAQKYRKVLEYAKVQQRLLLNVKKNLSNLDDDMALPMWTLLQTAMRIGNETYFKAHGHRGLTTLSRKNISIRGKNVTFSFLAKDGVPVTLTHTFPASYIKRLNDQKGPYIFTKHGKPLHELDFKQAFVRYCGKEFYPHIVRSHYATSTVQKFLKGKRKVTKEEINSLYTQIAHQLGHRKYDKKQKIWADNFTVTVHSYIQPELVEKVNSMMDR